MKNGVSVEGYRKLVAMMAWKAWRRLPMQTRMWIGIEDLIEHGMADAWKLSKRYNPEWATFSTALYHHLHRMFINDYLEHYSAQQRGWHRVEGKLKPIPHKSIQGMVMKNEDIIGTIPSLVTGPESIVNNVMTECFVVPALERIYKEASPRLKTAFVEWFLTTDASRVHLKAKSFKKRASEFRELCQHEQVTCNDCIHLVRSPSCLDTLNRNLFNVPRDLDRPCPAAERML